MGDIRLDITAQGDTSQAKKEVSELRQEIAQTNAQNESSVATSEAAAGAINAEGAAAEKTAGDLGTLTAAERSAAAGAETQAAATQASTATMSEAEAKMAAFQAQLHDFSAGAGAAAAGEAEVAQGAATVGTSFSEAALPLSYFALALVLLPQLLKAVDDGSKSLGDAVSELINGFDDESVAVRKSGESEAAYAARLREVRQAHDDLLRAKIAAAAGVIKETSDTKLLTVEYLAYASALRGAVDGGKAFLDGLKGLGLQIPETFDHLKVTAQVFLDTYKATLEQSGPAAAKFFAEENKARLTEVINDFIRLGQTVPPPLTAIAKEIGIVTEAEKSAAKERSLLAKADEEIQKFNALRDAIANAGQKYGDERIAIQALQKDIDGLIGKLEAQKLSTGKLTDAEQDQLNHLLIWRGQVAEMPGLLDKSTKAVEDHALKVAELSKKVDDNTRAFRDNLAKIEEHRKEAIAAAQDVAAKEIKSLQDGVAANEKAHNDRTISDTQYFTTLNGLYAAQAIAKQKEYEKEQQINQDAQKSQDDLVTKDTEAKTKLQENARDLGVTLDEAKDIATKLADAHKDVTKNLQDEATEAARAKVAVDGHTTSQKDFAKEMDGVLDKVGKANDGLKTHAGHHDDLHQKVPVTTKHVADLGNQFGVTAGEVPALSSALDTLTAKADLLTAAMIRAAAATASVTEGGGSTAIGGGEADSGGGGFG